jgi:hypothetical protein
MEKEVLETLIELKTNQKVIMDQNDLLFTKVDEVKTIAVETRRDQASTQRELTDHKKDEDKHPKINGEVKADVKVLKKVTGIHWWFIAGIAGAIITMVNGSDFINRRIGMKIEDIPYIVEITSAAERWGIDPLMAAAVVKTESGWQ